MKRAIALFLLLVMTLAAVQPTFALHFCRGELHSVAIGKVQKSCCGKTMENPLKPLSAHAGNRLYLPVNTCCSTYLIELSTDNFRLPGQLSIGDFQQILFSPLVFPENVPLKGRHSGISLSSTHFFPPGGLARYSADLLAVICIFRI
jgi:hypothetical protein